MRRNAHSTGMTLIELIVAVGIMSIIIVGVGYIFTQSTRAVGMTQATMDVYSGLRAGSTQMRSDMRNITKDGFLYVVAKPTLGAIPTTNAPALIFTVTGQFQSVKYPNVRANAAVILYRHCLDGKSVPDILSPGFLERYVLLLTGPRPPADMPATAPLLSDDIFRDGTGTAMTLADISAMIRADQNLSNLDMLVNLYCRPPYPFLDLAPDSIAGVGALWGYMIGNVRIVRFDFYDGLGADGQPLAPGPMAWLNPADTIVRPGPTYAGPDSQSRGGSTVPSLRWTRRDKGDWPKAIRVTLNMQDAARKLANPVVSEIILDVPQ